MSIKPWQIRAILAALAVTSAIIAYVALSQSWYQYDESRHFELTDATTGWRIEFFTDEYTRTSYSGVSSTTYTYSYSEGSYFWVPLEPMHSFMNTIETLVWLGVVLALVVAALAILSSRTLELVACSASVALFASVPIAFALGFVDASNETDFILYSEDLTSFMGQEVEDRLLYQTTVIWGPQSAWWLLMAACGVQCVGLALAIISRKK